MASCEASSRNRGPGARQAGLGGQGAPTLIGFSFFFSGAPLLVGGGAGGRRERVSSAGCGRVPPAWGPRGVAGQRPGGDCAGYYPAPTAPSPRGYFVPRVSRASRVGRVGLCAGRTFPAPPLTRRPPPRRQEAGAGLRSRPPASVRARPRLRASGCSPRRGQGCARALPPWGRPAGRRRAHSRRRVGAWSLTGLGSWGFYTPLTPHTQDAWLGARGREEDDPHFSLEKRTVGGGGGGRGQPGELHGARARLKEGGGGGVPSAAGGTSWSWREGQRGDAGAGTSDGAQEWGPGARSALGLSRGGTAGTARILEIKVNLGIPGRAGAAPSPTLLCLYSRALLGT